MSKKDLVLSYEPKLNSKGELTFPSCPEGYIEGVVTRRVKKCYLKELYSKKGNQIKMVDLQVALGEINEAQHDAEIEKFAEEFGGLKMGGRRKRSTRRLRKTKKTKRTRRHR